MNNAAFDLGNNDAVQGYHNKIKNQILGSFKGTEANLVKGITVEDFKKAYPAEKFEHYSFESLTKAKDELSKADDFKKEQFDEQVADMTLVIVQHQDQKKLMYVREKKA